LLSRWPIRLKMSIGLGLLVLVVSILASSGLYTMYAYRGLVKSLSWRVPELSVAAELSQRVSDLRITLSELHGLRAYTFSDAQRNEVAVRVWMVRDEFHYRLDQLEETLGDYRHELGDPARDELIMTDNRRELRTVEQIEATLARIHEANQSEDWMFDEVKIGLLDAELGHIQALAGELPSHLLAKLGGFADEVRGQYRTLIVGTWITSISATLAFALFVRLFWLWILQPLRTLIQGSRRVAAGDFDFRIHLDTNDEMSELAEAMNGMTARFQHVRDDLDAQVRERTKQVVRSEQLASVGFLAAGVAHEINNPLASIAMCAESLQSRMRDLFARPVGGDSDGDHQIALGGVSDGDHHSTGHSAARSPSETPPTDQQAVVDHYLQMIQDEAFRCKEITERLLDFSRIGPGERQDVDLAELVRGVVDMIGHLGKYQRKRIEFVEHRPAVAPVNAQEIKQVVLNLLTNALDSLDEDGSVRIEVQTRGGMAELTFTDDGCGIESDALEHIFEPFFTRRRAGQGTGLGLSITYRIVADHGGSIDAQSDGPGRGATFRVRLPLRETQKESKQSKESKKRYQAA